MSVISHDTDRLMKAAIYVASKVWNTDEEFKEKLGLIERACEADRFLMSLIIDEIIPDAATLRSVLPMMIAMGYRDVLDEALRMMLNKAKSDAMPTEEHNRICDEAAAQAVKYERLFGADNAVAGMELVAQLAIDMEEDFEADKGRTDFPDAERTYIGPPPVDTKGDDDETIDRDVDTLDQELEECDRDDSQPEITIQ